MSHPNGTDDPDETVDDPGDAPDDPDDPGNDTGDDPIDALADHLAATAELPVERTASAFLGEAEAVATDLADAGSELPPDVRRERLGHVRDLLDRIDDTESPAADEHVAAARSILAGLLDSEAPGRSKS